MQWFLFYTSSKFEKKVSEILSRKKIENYFPVKKIIKTPEITAGPTEEPLFPAYIFIKTTQNQFRELKKIAGIVNLVYWLGNPVVISDNEVKLLKQFLLQHVNIRVEKITIGQGVSNLIDTSITANGQNLIINKTVNIILPSLGYLLTGKPETSHVQLVSPKILMRRPKLAGFKLFNSLIDFNNFF